MRDERGWSLVELSVVAIVLGVLVSLGFASFAGATDKARSRAVEVELRTALEAALLLAQEAGGRFVVDEEPIGPEHLGAEEPSLRFADAGDRDVIGVAVGADAVTIRLDALDGGDVRHTLVAESGRALRFCTGIDPLDCVLDEPASWSSTAAATPAAATTGRSPGRQDGGTPAADHRQNGR